MGASAEEGGLLLCCPRPFPAIIFILYTSVHATELRIACSCRINTVRSGRSQRPCALSLFATGACARGMLRYVDVGAVQLMAFRADCGAAGRSTGRISAARTRTVVIRIYRVNIRRRSTPGIGVLVHAVRRGARLTPKFKLLKSLDTVP